MKKKKKAVKKTVTKTTKSAAKAAVRGLGMPYGDRVLVKPAPAEEKTSFGIILPESGKEKPERGIVVAVGPGKKNDDGKVVAMSLKVGDKIMFSKYGYDEIKIDGVEYYLIREDSITFIF